MKNNTTSSPLSLNENIDGAANARKREVSSFLADNIPKSQIKRICSKKWNVSDKTIERDINEYEEAGQKPVFSSKTSNLSTNNGSAKSMVASLIRIMLTGEGKTKSIRSIKVGGGLEDALSYPSFADSLNADDRFLKNFQNLHRRAENNEIAQNAILLFNRWLRMQKRLKRVKNVPPMSKNVLNGHAYNLNNQ